MLSIVIPVLLKTVIGQVDVVVVVAHVIVEGGGSEVAVLVHENVEVGGDDDSDSDVEFSPVVK